MYERITLNQQKALSAVLSSEKKNSFHQAMEIVQNSQQPSSAHKSISLYQTGPYRVINNYSVVIYSASACASSPEPVHGISSFLPSLDEITSEEFDLFSDLLDIYRSNKTNSFTFVSLRGLWPMENDFHKRYNNF